MSHPQKLNRDFVYEIIDGERTYQDSLGEDRTDNHYRTVGEYVTMLSHYTAKAIEAWTLNPGDAHALDQIRKIAGIAVHCMEEHGAVQRQSEPYPPGGVPKKFEPIILTNQDF